MNSNDRFLAQLGRKSSAMKKRIALLVYPEFSLQEIGNTLALFRWYFSSPTDVIASTKAAVRSEEGVRVLPDKTVLEFSVADYDCLILPGVSDVRPSLNDQPLLAFLRGLKAYSELVIGAIGGGPLFLSLSGLLKGKKFTNELYVEMNERLPFIEEENIQYQPLVVDENIITATSGAYAAFPIALARVLGYECPEEAYQPLHGQAVSEADLKFHLDEEGVKIFEETFQDFL